MTVSDIFNNSLLYRLKQLFGYSLYSTFLGRIQLIFTKVHKYGASKFNFTDPSANQCWFLRKIATPELSKMARRTNPQTVFRLHYLCANLSFVSCSPSLVVLGWIFTSSNSSIIAVLQSSLWHLSNMDWSSCCAACGSIWLGGSAANSGRLVLEKKRSSHMTDRARWYSLMKLGLLSSRRSPWKGFMNVWSQRGREREWDWQIDRLTDGQLDRLISFSWRRG